jgi:hypothetical protein
MNAPEKELAIELADAAMHAVLKDGLLKELAVVGPLINIVRLAKSIPDRIFARKVLAFLDELEKVKDLKAEKFLAGISRDRARRVKLSEVLVLALDRIDDLQKANYMAYAFMGYVEGKLDFEEFRRLLHAISESFPVDLDDFVHFMKSAKRPFYLPNNLRGLTSVGLACNSGVTRGGQTEKGIVPYALELGMKFAEIVALYRERCI